MNKNAKNAESLRELYFIEIEKDKNNGLLNEVLVLKKSRYKNKKISKYKISNFKRTTSNSAITLIALIVTIIVLLILAGVTLNMVIGENGIIKKANIAKEKTNASQQEENEKVEELENKLEDYTNPGYREKSQNGLVAFYNTVFYNATTTERELEVVDFNEDYATKNNNTITIKEPGEYTAYITVGHSPYDNTFSSITKLYEDNVSNINVVMNYYHTEGTKPYKITVEEGKNVNIRGTIYSDGNFSQGTITIFGSIVIVKNS